MKSFFERYVRGTDLLPLAKLLPAFGVTLEEDAGTGKPALGLALADERGAAKINTVFDHGAAQQAGLSAGDTLLAVNGLRVGFKGGKSNLDALLAPYRAGETVELHAFRRDELLVLQAQLQNDATPNYRLTLDARREKLLRPGNLKR